MSDGPKPYYVKIELHGLFWATDDEAAELQAEEMANAAQGGVVDQYGGQACLQLPSDFTAKPLKARFDIES